MPTIPYKLKDGTRVPGATTIIGSNLGWNKEQLKYWAWKEGQAGRDIKYTVKVACDAGTVAHYLIECNLKKIEPDLKVFDQQAIQAGTFAYETNFLPWQAMVKFEPIEMEPHLVSETHRYGGTPDCIARVNSKIAVFDWKTSGGLYPDMLMQLAAYEQLWNENNIRTPKVGNDAMEQIADGAYLLRIDKKTASFHFHHWLDLSRAWAAFKHLLALHYMKADLQDLV